MSQAEELLNSLDVSNASEESHIVIGKDRFITVPDALKRLAVQYDHDIETVTFDCPRYWDEHDMSKMGVYINYLCADKTYGIYQAKNVKVDETDSTVMHFDWTISRNVSFAAGPIAFLVCVRNADAEGFEKNHWNSEICTSCYISNGLEYDGEVIDNIMSPDLIEQWRKKVNEITDDLATRRDNGEFNGATFTPQVDDRGYISWSNDKNLANPPAVNIRGPKGISPKITVTDIQAGHRVSITDAEGTKTFDVMDTIVDGTDAVNELLNRFVSIGTEGDRPRNNLLFYTDVSDSAEGAFDFDVGAYLSYIDGSGIWHAFYPRTRKDLVFGMDEIDNFVAANKGIVAHSNDGIKYTATVPGITELTVGASFLMIPDKDAVTGNPPLNVNNFGDILLKTKTNISTKVYGDEEQSTEDIHWLRSGEPISVTYNGEAWVADFTLVYGSGPLVTPVSIKNGGTGATNIEQAAKNLKFNSLAYATELTGVIILDEIVDVGKYYILAEQFYADNNNDEFPFTDRWTWCTLTVEDARGEGHTIPEDVTSGYCYALQILENNIGEKFSRVVTFKNGQFNSAQNWVSHNTSANRLILNSQNYGTEWPLTPEVGTVFFKKNDGCYIYEGGTSGWVKYF